MRERERSRSHVDNYKSPINKSNDPRIKVDKIDEGRANEIGETISIEDGITSRKPSESDDYNMQRHNTAKENKTSSLIKGNRFTNQSPPIEVQKSVVESTSRVDVSDSYYEEDEFESMSISKSIGGIGFGLK